MTFSPRPRRVPVRASPRAGFIMMFALIAVAFGAYLMMETSPDFSNYAVMARSQQLDQALSSARAAINNTPFFLARADGAAGVAPNGVLAVDELKTSLEAMVVSSGAVVSASRFTMATVARDPYVNEKEWDQIYWSATFNFVQDPAFYDSGRREAVDEGSVNLVHLVWDTGPGSGSVAVSDRFGRRHNQIVSPGKIYKEISATADGTRILASSNEATSGVPLTRTDIVSFDSRGASRTFATTPNDPGSDYYPEWSPLSDYISFVTTGPAGSRRIAIKGPERASTVIDPIGQTFAAPSFHRMPPTTVGGSFLEVGWGAWSPDSSMVAFPAQESAAPNRWKLFVYNVPLRRWVLPEGGPSGGINHYDDCPEVRPRTPIVWMPDSDGLIYVANPDSIRMARGIKFGRMAWTLSQSAGCSLSNATALAWQRSAAGSSGITSATVFYYLASTGGGGAGELRRRRITDPPGIDYQLATGVYSGLIGATVESNHPFAVSPGGSLISYISTNKKELHLLRVGSTDDTKIRTGSTLAGPEEIREVAFLAPQPAWQYPSSTVSRLSAASRQGFDETGWRQFLNAQRLYPGDSRFGDGYLQVAPGVNDAQFFFDNGRDIFRIRRSQPGTTITSEGPIVGKLEPSWDPVGLNFIAREAADITGGFPSDVFKQVIGGSGAVGTTVLVTTGTAPAYSPSGKFMAVSKLMSASLTYPVDTAAYFKHKPLDVLPNPVDTDIWVVEVNGSPDPPPKNVTPDTTGTAEGRPTFSPDGRFVYFQRETQVTSPFLGNHSSGIYRVPTSGGAVTQVVGEGSIPPAWNDNRYVSALEFYEPSVSPCGTRVAFIARERLLGLGSLGPEVSTTRVGEIIGEALYVKDLLFNTAPVCLLRSYDHEVAAKMATLGGAAVKYVPKLAGGASAGSGATPVGNDNFADHGLSRPGWSWNGEEIFVTRTWPRNRWFPKKMLHTSGKVGNTLTYREILQRSQIIRVKATHPAGTVTELPDLSYDPPCDNFEILVRNQADTGGTYVCPVTPASPVFGDWGSTTERHILNATPSAYPVVAQRLTKDQTTSLGLGIGLGTDYVLSGYVRTLGGVGGIHAGQIMTQLLNNQGLLVDHRATGSPPSVFFDEYQLGLTDIGGDAWTRFSCGIRLQPPLKTNPALPGWGDRGPYTVVLLIYTLGGAGAIADFTGIKMEKAFDKTSKAPTVFSPGWTLHSSSLKPDPRKSESYIFER